MCTVSEVPTTNIITGSRAVIKSMLTPQAPITPRPHKMAPSTTISGMATPHQVRNVNHSSPVTSSTDRLMNTRQLPLQPVHKHRLGHGAAGQVVAASRGSRTAGPGRRAGRPAESRRAVS